MDAQTFCHFLKQVAELAAKQGQRILKALAKVLPAKAKGEAPRLPDFSDYLHCHARPDSLRSWGSPFLP